MIRNPTHTIHKSGERAQVNMVVLPGQLIYRSKREQEGSEHMLTVYMVYQTTQTQRSVVIWLKGNKLITVSIGEQIALVLPTKIKTL